MKVKELKAFLQHHGVGHQDCLEKADIQQKARTLISDLARQGAKSASGEPATESMPRGKDGAPPAYPSSRDAAVCAATLSSECYGSQACRGRRFLPPFKSAVESLLQIVCFGYLKRVLI